MILLSYKLYHNFVIIVADSGMRKCLSTAGGKIIIAWMQCTWIYIYNTQSCSFVSVLTGAFYHTSIGESPMREEFAGCYDHRYNNYNNNDTHSNIICHRRLSYKLLFFVFSRRVIIQCNAGRNRSMWPFNNK